MGWVNKKLSRIFYRLGELIVLSPKCFLCVSFVVAVILSSGLYYAQYENDLEYLYTVMDGESGKDRAIVEHFFPPNYTNRFDPSRATRILRFARILITEKNERDIANSSKIWEEIQEVDDIVQNTTILWKYQSYNYTSGLCAKWFDECFQNDQLGLGSMMEDVENGRIRLNYPVVFNPKTLKTIIFPLYFGGVELSANDSFFIKEIKGVHLNYVIAVDNDEQNERGKVWEAEIINQLMSRVTQWNHISVYPLTFNSFTVEMENNFFSMLKPFLIAVFFAGVFTLSSMMMKDCVRSKPLVGVMGIASAILGTSTGFGILCFLQVPLIGINIAIPFIMLGIGVDDMFVMMAAWRRTSILDPVSKRLAECYEDAAVSITITSITDVLSFYVGILTPIRSVQIFSAYAGTSVIGIYFWNIFFFGAAMAISGEYEAKNKHCLFWWIEATPKSKSKDLSDYKKLLFTGGVDRKDPHNPIDNEDHAVMRFFRDDFSKFICKPIVRLGILMSFVVYILVSIYGLSMLKEGLEEQGLVRDDSYMTSFYDKDKQYFRDYPHRYQIVVSTPLDYSLKETQDKIENMLTDLSSVEHMTYEYSENWLGSFTRFLENYSEFMEFNITSEKQFIEILRSEYLHEKFIFTSDVAFNEDKTKIVASRFVLQNKNMWDSKIIKDLAANLRKAAADQWEKNGLQVTVFHPWLHFVDQYLIIRDLTIKLVIIAAAIVMLVTIIFIPSFVCALCVFFSIFSIEIGVLGFMSLWGVNLDMISIVCIIMCIGFSVDFSAHISYAYISAKGNSIDRIQVAMHSLGLPIVQGAISTVIGMAALLCVPSYAFQANFKVICLVISFATWHALFLLPVFLMLLKPENYSTVSFGFFRQRSFNLEHAPRKKGLGKNNYSFQSEHCEYVNSITPRAININQNPHN